MMKKIFLLCSLMLIALLNTACSSLPEIEPWVMPYERQNLADPIMSINRDPVSSAYMHHVYQAREGAKGAEGGGGKADAKRQCQHRHGGEAGCPGELPYGKADVAGALLEEHTGA